MTNRTKTCSVQNVGNLQAFSRYLPPGPDALAWGLHILDAGYTHIPADSPYPPAKHPDGYMFTWQRGRVLSEYQMVYITRGSGSFESRKAGKREIGAGDVFLLFPGGWHRYRPDPSTGWDEHWIGFSGSYAEQVMSHFFPANEPVLHVGHDETLLQQFQSVAEMMQSAPPGYRQMMAADTVAALARVRGLAMKRESPTGHHAEKIEEACLFLLEHAAQNVDLKALAARLGYSYSRFRLLFKEQTGLSPRRYQIEIRFSRARDFLTQSDQTISQISDRLGFYSVYYFSRFFKERTGMPPSVYRKQG
jgi:AraC-like DNA-binding protein